LFAGQSRKPDRQNALMLAIGAVLAIILIVLLVIWFLSPGAAIEIELQSQSESEAESVASAHTVQTHGQEAAPPDDGASDMDCDDQTRNYSEGLECNAAKPQQ
jgi:flagellar biosynthesis/type III secretory pathway M-ring protein FliF/YscJ